MRLFLILSFLNTFFLKMLVAQSNQDLSILQQHFSATNLAKENHAKILHSHNPLTFPFRATLFFYQRIISPQWQSGCPHSPSCSNFSLQAIARFGLIQGVALSADRLMRCSGAGLRDYPSYQFDFFTGKVDDNPVQYYWKKRITKH